MATPWRNLSLATRNQMIQQSMHPVMFVDLAFGTPPGRVCLHDYVGDIKWGGNTYIGVAALGNVDDIEEANEMANISLKLNLSGVDDDIIQAALSSDYYRRPVTLASGFLHTVTGRLLTPVETIWRGYIDILEIAVDSNEKRVSLTAENEDVDFERPNGSLYAHAQQIQDYPGDTGLQFLESIERAEVRWPSKDTRSYGTIKPLLDKATTRGPS